LNEARQPGAWLEGDRLFFNGNAFADVRDIRLAGRHNIENTLAAALAAGLAGASLEAIASAVRTFTAVEHRLEFVRQLRGVRFYNDSKATSVDATLKALDALDPPLWLILGGEDKGSDYRILREPVAEKVKTALLIGSAAPKIREQLNGSVELIEVETMKDAVAVAHTAAQAGDTVLLAPACASFDQFENFEHRGRVFKDLVNRLE
jgi:UDP-N-acetylmuramoylalanine--D-glutamate ligase